MMGSLLQSQLGLGGVLADLALHCREYEEDSGVWLHIVRTNFDLFLLEEPYLAMGLLVNSTSGEYILRVLGSTRERGFYASTEDLLQLVDKSFRGTVACVGNPLLREEQGAVRVEQPFQMTVSRGCIGYYRPGGQEEIAQGRGRCPQCSVLPSPLEKQRIIERRTNDEDIKILSGLGPKPSVAEGGKKKRGRPRKVPEDLQKLKKTLSDKTKKKIAENNRKFSICKLCSKQCRGFRGLVDHMHRDHSDYKPWQCSHCTTKTAFVKTLYRHLKQRHGISECPCPRCGKTYSRAQSMLFHVNKHEENEMKFFQCNHCQSRFKKKEKLDQHIQKKHSGGFECETCGKKFPEQSSLKEHMRVHTGERPHQCTECGQTFSFQSTFIAHRKMHFREQGLSEEEAKLRLYYFCDTCGKSYANKASLRLHKLHVHEKYSEEVPCDVCGISFRTRELLKQHQEREHSAEPKFVCDECGQRFGNSSHLKRHMTSHSTDGFPCSHCSRVFKRKDGLETHFSHAHRDITGAEDSSNAGKPPVLESLDLSEIEVPGVLLEVPAGPAGELLDVQPSDLPILSPSLTLGQDLQQLSSQDLLNPESNQQETFISAPNEQSSTLSIRDGFNSAVNSILNRELGAPTNWVGSAVGFDFCTLETASINDSQDWPLSIPSFSVPTAVASKTTSSQEAVPRQSVIRHSASK